jgi:hypothetical protein
MRDLGIRSLMRVPLIARERPIGVLTFGLAGSGRRDTPADLVLAEEHSGLSHVAPVARKMHSVRCEDVYSGAPPSRYRRFVTSLPTTRSRTITRSVLKEVRIERERGDISTVEDEGSVCGVAGAWQSRAPTWWAPWGARTDTRGLSNVPGPC